MESIKRELGEWSEKWQSGETGWHIDEPHWYFDLLLNGQKNAHVLLPLCGKSVDIKWLTDRGCHVVGIEISDQAIKMFFSENGLIPKESEPAEGVKLFQTDDEMIKIYQCDLFHEYLMNELNDKFDAVLDRGSLVAINVEDRQKYLKFIDTVTKKNANILLVTMEYQYENWLRPPHLILQSELEKLFDNVFTIRRLESQDVFDDKRGQVWGTDYVNECAYILNKMCY